MEIFSPPVIRIRIVHRLSPVISVSRVSRALMHIRENKSAAETSPPETRHPQHTQLSLALPILYPAFAHCLYLEAARIVVWH